MTDDSLDSVCSSGGVFVAGKNARHFSRGEHEGHMGSWAGEWVAVKRSGDAGERKRLWLNVYLVRQWGGEEGGSGGGGGGGGGKGEGNKKVYEKRC